MDGALLYAILATSTFYLAVQLAKRRTHNLKLSSIPSVNGNGLFSYVNSILKSFSNSREIIQEGYDQYQGRMFRFSDIFGSYVVATTQKHVEDVRSATDDTLSVHEAMVEVMQTTYTFKDVMDDPYHNDFIRGPLTRNIVIKFDEVREEVIAAFEDEIPQTADWIRCTALKHVLQIVARTSNRIFVGLPLCRNQEFLDLNIKFTVETVIFAQLIKPIPEFLKPLVARFFAPISRRIKGAIKLLEPSILERMRKQEEYGSDYPDKPNDLLSWLLDNATGQRRTMKDLVLRVIGTNFTAIHTTSVSFTNALYYLAAYPQYHAELREEVESIVKEHGWSKATMQRMRKLDSFLKEAERLSTLGGLGVGRKALRDFTFSDGNVVPAGTIVMLPLWAIHHDDRFYEDPNEFKPFRFSDMRTEEGEGVKHQMITPGKQYLFFGIGRHACPGRFFAVNELKVLMTHVLMNYDVKLEDEGVVPKQEWFGFISGPNSRAEVMFRKRRV